MALVEPTVEIFFDLDATGGDVFTLDDTVKGQLDDTTYVLGGGGSGGDPTDITSYVYAYDVSRGRSRELDEINAGIATVRLRNYDGELVPDGFLDTVLTDENGDPLTDGSGNVLTVERVFGIGAVNVGKRCRIILEGQTIFDGTIDDWDFQYLASGQVDASFTASDALADLAAIEFDEWTATGSQTAGPRITAALNRSEVDYGPNRVLDTGVSTLQGDTVAATTNVLTYLQLVARSDLGRLFASRDNSLTFKDRHGLVNPTVRVAFADDGSGVTFNALEPAFGSEVLHNRVVVERTGGTAQTADNAASQTKYRIRTLSLTGLLLDSDVQALDMAEFLSNIYSEPQARIASLSVIVDDLTSVQRADVLSLDLADAVSVDWTPTGVTYPAGVTEYVVEGVSHSKSFDSVHTVTLALSPIAQAEAFILDDAVLGVLDSGVLAF